MQLQRNEVMTGLVVVGTVAIITAVLILLGAPGLFRPLVIYKIYVDNAAGIKQGAAVMLAGRKIGEVAKNISAGLGRRRPARSRGRRRDPSARSKRQPDSVRWQTEI